MMPSLYLNATTELPVTIGSLRRPPIVAGRSYNREGEHRD